MEIQQLKGFHAVAKHKNFTLAAKETKRTQPTISLQIKALEQELGVKLFERLGPKKVVLTTEGKLFRELSAGILQDLTYLPAKLHEALGSFNRSSVRLATHNSIMVHLLPPVVRQFKRDFPDCQLVILNRSKEEIVQLLEEGEIDIGITSIENPPSTIDLKIVAAFNRILITHRDHPLAQKNPIKLEDFSKYPMVVPPSESNTRRVLDRLLAAKGLTYQVSMEVVGRDAIKSYVAMNLGISVLSEHYITSEDRSRLVLKDVSKHFGKSKIGVCVLKSRRLPKPVLHFIDTLQSQLNGNK